MRVWAERCATRSAESRACSETIIPGGDPSSPSWAEYLEQWQEDFRPYLKAARAWLLEQRPVPTGEEFSNDYHLRFEDGRVLAFTWRGWGDFAQAAVDRREGYMAYYMDDSRPRWVGPS